MLNTSIVYPMAAMVGFTFLFLLYMGKVRIQAIKNGTTKATYFKTYDDGQPSRLVRQTERHFSNLFELPVIFYATCLTIMAMGLDSKFSVTCAWGFVVCRVVHAYIHVTSNKIPLRMGIYLLSWVMVLLMWVQILRFL